MLEVVKLSKIDKYKGFKCGLEFREIPVDEALKAVQPNIHACFRGQIMGKMTTICSTAQNRPVYQARRLMRKMHNLCINIMLEAGEITDA